jgi:hypothetical protein
MLDKLAPTKHDRMLIATREIVLRRRMHRRRQKLPSFLGSFGVA